MWSENRLRNQTLQRGILAQHKNETRIWAQTQANCSCIYWKIEGSLNEKVKGGIIRMNSRQPMDSIPPDCWEKEKTAYLCLL